MLIKIHTCVTLVLSCKKIGYLIFCTVYMSEHKLMALCRRLPCIKSRRDFWRSPIYHYSHNKDKKVAYFVAGDVKENEYNE
jgi:hypothetical protein